MQADNESIEFFALFLAARKKMVEFGGHNFIIDYMLREARVKIMSEDKEIISIVRVQGGVIEQE